jgi:hypothetical protein
MSKAHLLDQSLFESPLDEGSDITANCGKVIPRAKFAFEWIPGEGNLAPVSTLMLCSSCLHLSLARTDKRRLYGLVTALAVASSLEGKL